MPEDKKKTRTEKTLDFVDDHYLMIAFVAQTACSLTLALALNKYKLDGGKGWWLGVTRKESAWLHSGPNAMQYETPLGAFLIVSRDYIENNQ